MRRGEKREKEKTKKYVVNFEKKRKENVWSLKKELKEQIYNPSPQKTLSYDIQKQERSPNKISVTASFIMPWSES